MDGTLRIWNLDTGSELRASKLTTAARSTRSPFSPTAGAFFPVAATGTSACGTSTLAVKFIGLTVLEHPLRASRSRPMARHALSSGSADHHLRLWDLESGRAIYSYEVPHVSLTHGTFTPDGRQALWAGYDGVIRLWNLPAQFEGTPKATDSRR